ncbi:MAG: hypothetical protein KBG75_13615 [Pseudomonadales bacterium]|nr:hypothetical protein [Pseudomonadales bacterium]
MSRTMDEVYQSALLSGAAYVSLQRQDFLIGTAIADASWSRRALGVESFAGRGFTHRQFAEVQRRYQVLHHQPDTTSGFSATLFENTVSGELHLAFRGTTELGEEWREVALALEFARQLGALLRDGVVDDFLRAAGVLDAAGNANPAYIGRLGLTGHSLGGHLALWTAVDHPELVMGVDTFNGAGMSCSAPVMVLLETLWRDTILPALSTSSLDPGRVHNFYADPGPQALTTRVFGYRPGEHVSLFIEDRSGAGAKPLENHAMEYLLESLALYRVFGALDASLSFNDVSTILEGSSNIGDGSIATTIAALGDALGEEYAGLDDAVALFDALGPDLAAGAWSGARIKPLSDLEMSAIARENSLIGSSYRFALLNFHSFALVAPGAVSSGLALTGFTSEYIEHRSFLLESLLLRNRGATQMVAESGRVPHAPWTMRQAAGAYCERAGGFRWASSPLRNGAAGLTRTR